MNGNDTGVEDDDDNNFLDENQEWGQWAPIIDDYDVLIPPINDRYNGRDVLKPMVASRFDTILQCVFRCTATNSEPFQIISCQQNKYAQDKTSQMNSNLFIGWKWKNISVGEMVGLFSIMLGISLEQKNIGGYVS